MAEEKRSDQKKTGELTRSLPRNYRQIGEPGAKKIYIEDYVYTYLNKLAQPENLYARGAVLFGKMYKTSIGKCIFISGAAACQNFELDLEETIFQKRAGEKFIVLEILSSLKWKSADGFYQEWGFR
ncbi:MAG: hypothetical protein ACLTS6_03350 [Anaerobutyricum sp.]